jgi:hypothetical protein
MRRIAMNLRAIDDASFGKQGPVLMVEVAVERATSSHPCPCCGGRMRIIKAFAPGYQPQPQHRPSATTVTIRIDTS